MAAVGGLAIHCLAGKVAADERREAETLFVENLKRAADEAAARGIKLYIEPINPRDLPNYFLDESSTPPTSSARSAATTSSSIRFLSRADRRLRYHRALKKYQPLIAHLQCSQVPVRHEPDADGEINYPFVFAEPGALMQVPQFC